MSATVKPFELIQLMFKLQQVLPKKNFKNARHSLGPFSLCVLKLIIESILATQQLLSFGNLLNEDVRDMTVRGVKCALFMFKCKLVSNA